MKGFSDESKSQVTNSRSTQFGGRVGTRPGSELSVENG